VTSFIHTVIHTDTYAYIGTGSPLCRSCRPREQEGQGHTRHVSAYTSCTYPFSNHGWKTIHKLRTNSNSLSLQGYPVCFFFNFLCMCPACLVTTRLAHMSYIFFVTFTHIYLQTKIQVFLTYTHTHTTGTPTRTPSLAHSGPTTSAPSALCATSPSLWLSRDPEQALPSLPPACTPT
jgi:hypothetical protein